MRKSRKIRKRMGRPEPCVLFAQTFVHPQLDEYVDEVSSFSVLLIWYDFRFPFLWSRVLLGCQESVGEGKKEKESNVVSDLSVFGDTGGFRTKMNCALSTIAN